jgi:hypothetical protein
MPKVGRKTGYNQFHKENFQSIRAGEKLIIKGIDATGENVARQLGQKAGELWRNLPAERRNEYSMQAKRY